MCWGRLVIPAFGRLGQEAHDYKASLDYIARSCVKLKQQKPFRMEGGGREEHGPSFLLATGSPAALSVQGKLQQLQQGQQGQPSGWRLQIQVTNSWAQALGAQ